MTTVTTVAFAILAVAVFLCLARLVRGPSLADRIVALDTVLVLIVSGIAVGAARTGSGVFLDVLVVTALLGFVGTVNVARFIERRGA
ncbi:MAG: monovalent cation/H+ antiporter complex subunit F [Actinomycetota bacterium]|jgi:multicomponent Na+:H+ antiporter subunit F